MGCCCSKQLTREEVEEETETRKGRLRALLRRLRPRAYFPIIETLDDGEGLSMHGRSTSTAGRLVEGDDGEVRQLRESLGERESETEQFQNRVSEPMLSLPLAVSEAKALQQQHGETAQQKDEAEASRQVTKLETRISELSESSSEVELAALKQNCDELTEHNKTEDGHRNQIAQLENRTLEMTEDLTLARSEPESLKSEATPHHEFIKPQEEILQREAKVSELTEGRAIVEEEPQQREESEGRAIVEKKLQQREESEAALRSQITQLQEEISQMKLSLTAFEESWSLAENAPAQLQQQHDPLKKTRSKRLQAPPELRDLMNELAEVTEWMLFGVQLKVPWHELLKIKNDHQGDTRKSYMLQDWLNEVGSEASWANIVAALVRIRMRGLAHRLAEKYGVPVPPVDEEPLETQRGAGNNEDTRCTELQAEIQRLCGKLDEKDRELTTITDSLETEKGELESLAKQEMMIKEQLKAKTQELHSMHLHAKELSTVVKNKQGEIEQLQSNLSETEGQLKSAREEVKKLTEQLSQARTELEARQSRVQELEGERAKLQAELNRERSKVEHTLIQKAVAVPTQEPAHEMECQHDQAMLSGHEVTTSQEDSQREGQIKELQVKTSEVESLRLVWSKCQDAPETLERGSAAVDTDRHTVYFSGRGYASIYAYEWQSGEWFRMRRDCPSTDHALAVVGGLLTAVGGTKSGIHTNVLLSLVGDRSERRWEEHFPPMPTKRPCCTAVCSGIKLVVIGGGQHMRLTIVEVLNTDTQQWLTASNLLFPLTLATATIVGDNIYLVGGVDKSGRESRSVLTCSLTAVLQSCQPRVLMSQSPPVWHQLADIPAFRSTCATLNGKLLAIGGRDSSSTPTDEVYTYDPVTDSWNVVSHMNITRSKCLAVVIPGDRLMVVGGKTRKDKESQTASVEMATLYNS